MIRNILLVISLLALGLYGISIVPTLNDRMQVAVVVSLVAVIALAIIYPKVDFDFKLILICISGYILCGKKFAYLSPFEPVFIGEICLGVSFIMVLGRVLSRGLWHKLFDTPIHIIIWFFLIYGGLRLYIDYPKYGLLSLKDAATVYYALFFLIAYIILQYAKNIKIFESVLPTLFTLGLIALFMAPLLSNVGVNLSFALTLFHKDAYIGAALAGLFGICFYMLKHKSSFAFFVLCFFCLLILLNSSMAVMFAIACIIFLLILVAKQYSILLFGVGITVLSGITFILLFALDSPIPEKIINEFNTIDLSEMNSGQFRGNTSGWRLAWWGAIWDQTMLVNPWFGLGLGADLSSAFSMNYYGSAAGEFGNKLYGVARYPHNILFTVIGRLGLIGASIFIIYFICIIHYLIKFIKIYCRGNIKYININYIGVACFVIAGLANSLVQSTYEAPYAAIPHWILVAYMVVKVKNYQKSKIVR